MFEKLFENLYYDAGLLIKTGIVCLVLGSLIFACLTAGRNEDKTWNL
jgi:hypothetical protein